MSELTGSVQRKRVRVLVSGDVQGVGFRWWTRDAAGGLGLDGWVRNRSDGRVEAVFEGSPEAVDRAVAWCGTGPRWATVSALEVLDEPPEGVNGFTIVR